MQQFIYSVCGLTIKDSRTHLRSTHCAVKLRRSAYTLYTHKRRDIYCLHRTHAEGESYRSETRERREITHRNHTERVTSEPRASPYALPVVTRLVASHGWSSHGRAVVTRSIVAQSVVTRPVVTRSVVMRLWSSCGRSSCGRSGARLGPAHARWAASSLVWVGQCGASKACWRRARREGRLMKLRHAQTRRAMVSTRRARRCGKEGHGECKVMAFAAARSATQGKACGQGDRLAHPVLPLLLMSTLMCTSLARTGGRRVECLCSAA